LKFRVLEEVGCRKGVEVIGRVNEILVVFGAVVET
jgi:hypothetical protein